jgi:hypothetical protein
MIACSVVTLSGFRCKSVFTKQMQIQTRLFTMKLYIIGLLHLLQLTQVELAFSKLTGVISLNFSHAEIPRNNNNKNYDDV